MNNKVQIFNNTEFGQFRTVEENGKVLFCGSDVAKALGYDQPHKAIERHCRCGTKHTIPHPQSPNKTIEMLFVSEGDLYRLIANSKLPAAEKFERWVFDEVLPTIRKTGGYVSNEDAFIATYLPHADEQTRQMFRATLSTVRSLNAKIEQDKPKVLFADSVAASQTSILVGELAKLLKQNGVDMGQNRLFKWLRQNGYLIKRKGTDYNMPTQRAMEMELFEIKETCVTHSDGHITISKTPKVSGRGQVYFVECFLNKKFA